MPSAEGNRIGKRKKIIMRIKKTYSYLDDIYKNL